MMKNNKAFLVLLLGTLSAFGPFVLDVYLPSLPDLAEVFHTTASMAQLSLTTAMVGLALGQLFIGSLSDKFGRKRPLLISLAVYTVSSALLYVAANIGMFIALRIVQGAAAAGGVVISRAVAADLYEGREMNRFFALLMTVNGVAPVVSPVLGSLLLRYTDWRGIFVFLTALGIVLALGCLRLRESLPPAKRLKNNVLANFAVFAELLRLRTFMLLVGVMSCALATMFAYIAASSFLFQRYYGLSELAYALCFAANGTALIAGAWVAGRFSAWRALRICAWGILLSACGVALILWWKLPVVLVEAGFFLLLCFIGMASPAVSALAMTQARAFAGSASALLGFFPFLAGAFVSPLVGLGNILQATAVTVALGGLCTFLIYRILQGSYARLAAHHDAA